MDELLLTTMLFDFYGELLTKKQKNVFELYYLYDFSLNEISSQLNISRQAVQESIKRTKTILKNYEQKLGLIKKYLIKKQKIDKIIKKLDNLDKQSSKQIKQEIISLLD